MMTIVNLIIVIIGNVKCENRSYMLIIVNENDILPHFG